jgi:hypothetical protein
MQSVNALTIRNVPPELVAALESEKRRRGVSLNQTVLDLLQSSLGVRASRGNGLARLAGTWSEADHQAFLQNIAGFSEFDTQLRK